ncbi:hypothetical protein [Chamaesiphon sp. VAR_48_metabat_135_sub]|uniref:hypothetical protein n=1 Tax=Chamaesiphon sp. VAR_48_metabat_135_sub TaxID=2964699 RepID=UPI00286A82A4|nr:hypothetical protein [Chamaesiphon sp. VAR_48_metabat_135_sub]
MISCEEFRQKLHAGQIQEALAILREPMELDVTTRMTDNSRASSDAAGNEYLRTKINLLTGKIQNEVGKDATIDSSIYLELQQLHIARVAADYRIVQDYLDRIKAIVTVLLPTSSAVEIVSTDRLNLDFLRTSLSQSPQNSISQEQGSNTSAEIISSGGQEAPIKNCKPTNLPEHCKVSKQQQSPPIVTNNINTELLPHNADIDDDIDLSIDEAGTVWEEWIEDEESILASILPQPPASTMSIWGKNSVRQHLHPIELKPMIPRPIVESVDYSAQWDKFVPEHIGIDADSQHPIGTSRDAEIDDSDREDNLDRLLADFGI